MTTPRTRWMIRGVAYLGIIAIGLPYLGWTVALNDVASDLSLSYAQAGLLSSVTALTGGISLVLGGIATEKIGCKMIILLWPRSRHHRVDGILLGPVLSHRHRSTPRLWHICRIALCRPIHNGAQLVSR